MAGAYLQAAQMTDAVLGGAHLETLYVNPLKSETLQ
jgi:hypothetical protein